MPSSTKPDVETPFRTVSGKTDSPLVLDVSRSGRRYPPEFRPSAPFHTVHAKVSPYVERVVQPSTTEGATLLIADFPATFIDPNRPIDDIDPDSLDGEWPTTLNPLPRSLKTGSGLIHTMGSDYAPLYEGKLPVGDVARRISDYYIPYHEALTNLLAEKRQKFGSAFQLSCHSMSSVGPSDGLKRPEICLGDLDGTTATPAYVETVTTIFRDHGYEVATNKPFRGNELLKQNAAPSDRIFCLQVEMRRDLYLDEKTRELHDGLTTLQNCFIQIAAAVRSAR